MRIGLVGKPNVGKSTFFSAATLAKVDIANYPFCTIDANVGVAFIHASAPCPCFELRERLQAEGRMEPIDEKDPRQGSICQPRTGSCIGFRRYVPCHLVDVAGLVPGASEGRGRGNAFLSDLANCTSLIQVIDASASTDIEGNPIEAAGDVLASMNEEISFLTDELDSWICSILADGWSRGTRRVQAEGEKGLAGFLLEKLSGIGATHQMIHSTIEDLRNDDIDLSNLWQWDNTMITEIAKRLRPYIFPINIAANKADLAIDEPWNDIESTALVIPTMADMELALRRADASGLITYESGECDFSISAEKSLNEAQKKALHSMHQRLTSSQGTGISQLLEQIVFESLQMVVVYPVQDEGQWVDGDGRILPDALIVKNGINAKQLAYQVHTDLGDGFIKGIDGRSKRTIGAEHELENNAIVKIHSR
jgi:ribosome-binding ATPase YchF (GTP1/OBG family)